MVTVIDFKATKNQKGEDFYALVLQGDVEFVQSQTTGQFYATSRTAQMTTTFNEDTCISLVGKQLPGTIDKVECDSYEYTNKETGQVLTLHHTYQYNPEQAQMRA